MKTRLKRHGAMLLLLSLLTACAASTEPLGEWVDADYRGGAARRVLVIAAIERSTRRRVFEDYLVDTLKAAGAEPSPSHELLTSSLTLSRAQLSRAIAQLGVDAVLVMRLAPVDPRQDYRPPAETGLYEYHDNAFATATRAGRAPTVIETALFDTGSSQLSWSMQSAVMQASQPRNFIEAHLSGVVERLRRAGLIGGG